MSYDVFLADEIKHAMDAIWCHKGKERVKIEPHKVYACFVLC